MPRKQLATNVRCWTHYEFNKAFKGRSDLTYLDTVKIIETIHEEMIEHLYKTRRPIQIKKSIGYITLSKLKFLRPKVKKKIINWKKSRELNKRVMELNHHTDGYVFRFQFQFSNHGRMRLFKFVPMRKHNRELAQRIFRKDVQ